MTAKRHIKHLFVVWGIALVLSSATAAQSQTNPSPGAKRAPAANNAPTLTADQILDRYVKAIGGADAWQKLNTRISTGTIDVPAWNLTGLVVVKEKAPNMGVFTVNFNGAVFQQGFDGTIGWDADPQNGIRAQAGDELQETKRGADFYHPLDLRKIYSKITVTGAEKVNGRAAYVVEASAGNLPADRIYFDVENALVIRITGKHYTQEGPVDFIEDFSEFREVDGIKLPYMIHQDSPSSTFTINFTEIRHNDPIEDSVFAKPESSHVVDQAQRR